LALWFVEDQSKSVSERQVVTFLDLLSNLGGIMKFIIFIGLVFTRPVQSYIFESAIMQNIFTVEPEPGDDKNSHEEVDNRFLNLS
jgi:hypothetical protein